MAFLSQPRKLLFTHHAKAKMAFYKLSEARVRRVLHSPKRIQEGVAVKTVAMMQPASSRFVSTTNADNQRSGTKTSFGLGKRTETWSQEIWVMFQDSPEGRKIISAWRYPGVTKPGSQITKAILAQEYGDYNASEGDRG